MAISDRTVLLIALEEYFQRLHGAAPACGKVAYSADEAKRALQRLRKKRRNRRSAERRSYRCDRCGWWHLASHPR